MTPLLTIGLPVYNGEDYLEAALQCLLGQDMPDFELYVSDNQSTDRTAEICRDYASSDKRIQYVRREKNIGATGNFNRVFTDTRSPLFKWAADDDVCDSSYIRKCVERLQDDDGVDWCHSQSQHIDPAGAVLHPNEPPTSYNEEPCPRSAERAVDRFQSVLMTRGCLDSYGVMRREAVEKTRLYLPFFGSEKVFLAEMALAGRYAEVPEVLFHPRVHGSAGGALQTAEEQQAFASPEHQVRFGGRPLQLQEMRRAIARSPLTAAQRGHCHWLLLRYLLQVRKWPRIVRKLVTATGVTEPAAWQAAEEKGRGA